MTIKKSLVILPAVVLATVFLSGCGSKPTGTGETNNKVSQEADGSIVGSLKDAIGMGKKMTCVSKDPSGDTTAYIDGKKYKSVTVTKEGNQVALFTGEDFYGWNEKTRQGFKMTKACTDELSKNVPESDGDAPVEDNFITTEEIVEEEEAGSDCKETTVPVDFSIPQDVNFVDQCELMKNIQNNMPINLQDLQIPGQ